MQSSHLQLSVCKRFVFRRPWSIFRAAGRWKSAHSTLLCTSCGKMYFKIRCTQTRLFLADETSKLWVCLSLSTRAQSNSDSVPCLIRTKWKIGPSRCSCCVRKADCVSAGALERFSTDLGANDTFICRGCPPIMTMEGRLRP